MTKRYARRAVRCPAHPFPRPVATDKFAARDYCGDHFRLFTAEKESDRQAALAAVLLVLRRRRSR